MPEPTTAAPHGRGRRRFLAVAGLVALGIAAGAIGWRRRQLIGWLARPAIAPAPPGALPGGVSRTLVASARALLGEPITEDVYADFFAWRAEHVPGLRALYVAYARHVDAEARRAGAPDFARATPAVRARIVAALAPRRRWQRLLAGVTDRDALRWSQQVTHETRKLFLRTDVWLRLGYDAFPGEPAGLAGLDAPPRGRA